MIDSFREVLVIQFFILLIIPEGTPQYESSPCPRVFSYRYDQERGLYGVVRIVNNHNSRLQLNIEMVLGNRVQGYNGHIELSKNKEEVIQDIVNYRPIIYKVFFPAWRRIPPQITKIIVNGDLICSGPRIGRNLVPVLTTINLQHTTKVDILPLSFSNGPDGNNIFHPGDEVSRPKFDRFSPSSGFENDIRLPRTEQQADRLPPDETTPSRPGLNSGQPISLPNDRRKTFPVTYIPEDISKEQDEIFKLNPNNPFFFRSMDDHYDVENTSEIKSPIFRGNPFFLTTMMKSKTELNPVTTSTLVEEHVPPLTKRGPGESVNSKTVLTEIGKVSSDTAEVGIPYENICGRSVSTNELVVHGDTVPRGAYPWLAAIFWVKPTGLNYMCSGSLISDRHVVTAAHCAKKDNKVLKPNELLVILGKLNVQKWVPSHGERIVEPEAIHVHPDYMAFSGDADVAVLVLSEKMEFTKYVRPLCLWDGNSELEKIVGKQGTVVGWGKDEDGNLMTEEPKQIRLPIVSQETCLRSSYQFQYITSNRTFCAGFRNGSGPCNGDSGSGFIMQRHGRWMLRGVVSTSISDNRERTCDLSNYVVFTDTSKFYDWFLSFIK
ncbi:serine protease gd isoform X1 [Leptinotarsa decemlineata]|uniref:serine protease gd isoform X1 n=1 Tax=Leptinotarsa decemlineata TaxID=7539 RepID=UPI003D30B9B6